MIYDIAIIGAGPAGTSAAAELEKHFDSILLLEKDRFPREKLCAGVLPPRIHSLIDIPEEVRERSLAGYRIFSPSGRSVESEFAQEGVIVRREVFDEFLLNRLETKSTHDRVTGIEFENDPVKINCEKESFQARFIIGADGVNSIVRSALNIPMDKIKIALAMQVEITLDEHLIDERMGNWFEVYYILPSGYGWVSPLKNALKVGMGGISKDFKINAIKHLKRFIEYLGDRIETGKIGEYKSWRIPMCGPLETLTGTRSILVGDSGGFVYPGTGEGVYYGMKSGQLAGQTVKEAFDQNKFDQSFLENNYTQKLDAQGLLSLRDINFIDDVLASEETAENYVKRLSLY